jgi:hypothetical protein
MSLIVHTALIKQFYAQEIIKQTINSEELRNSLDGKNKVSVDLILYAFY